MKKEWSLKVPPRLPCLEARQAAAHRQQLLMLIWSWAQLQAPAYLQLTTFAGSNKTAKRFRRPNEKPKSVPSSKP